MNPTLKQFYDNELLRENVKEFFIKTLKEMAIDRVFGKQAISGLYEAKKMVDLAFDKLEETYGLKNNHTIDNAR